MSRSKRKCSNVTPNDIVVLYPSFGYQIEDDGSWRIAVQGTVFERGSIGLRKRLLIRLLQRVMNASRDDLESAIFQDRIRGFIIGTERGKRVGLRLGSRQTFLRRGSNRSGHFQGAIRLSTAEAERLDGHGTNGHRWVEFEAIGHCDAPMQCIGRAQLLSPTGVSVISDIDDTIKHTDAISRRELLANTFLREFRSVEGMAALYQEWFKLGAAFHYVSASPWQLFEPLYELCRREGFPPGSFHLRSFRLRDHMLRRVLLLRRSGKSTVIRSILSRFPRRTFVLVGDSGEKDPEIYGAIARRFPDRVASILIRNLPHRPLEAARLRKAFREIPAGRWQLFDRAEEIADTVSHITQ